MHGLSTEGSKPNLYGRLRNFMRNGKIKNVNVKSEPGLLPLLLPKQVLAMQAGNVPYEKQQKQVQAHSMVLSETTLNLLHLRIFFFSQFFKFLQNKARVVT